MTEEKTPDASPPHQGGLLPRDVSAAALESPSASAAGPAGGPVADPQPLYAALPSRRALRNRFQKQGIKAVEDGPMGSSDWGQFREHYAPGFELFHHQAHILLIGCTPGRSQADTAWRELSQTSEAESSQSHPLPDAAFSGLWKRLDALASHGGLLSHLAPNSLSDNDAVSLTSRLVFPVVRAGKNDRIGTEYVKTPWLLERAGHHLRERTALTPKLRAAIFLGDGQPHRRAPEPTWNGVICPIMWTSLASPSQRCEQWPHQPLSEGIANPH